MKEINDGGRIDKRRKCESSEGRLRVTKYCTLQKICFFFYPSVIKAQIIQTCDAAHADVKSPSQFLVAASSVCGSFMKIDLVTVIVLLWCVNVFLTVLSIFLDLFFFEKFGIRDVHLILLGI